MNKRKLLKTGAALATGTAVAGCTDGEDRPVSTPDSDDNSSNDSGSDEESESEGLELGFTWDDVLEAEQGFYEPSAYYKPGDADQSAIEVADRSIIENADLTDYDEFQDSLVGTLNEIIDYLGDYTDGFSSSMTQDGAAAVNLILSDVLEDREMKAKMMPVSWSGHGYTQVASTEHPLTLVDSNSPAVGPTTERPLQERNNIRGNTTDYVADMQDQDYADIDNRTKKALVRSFPNSIYSRDIEEEVYMVFDGSIVDDIYDQAIFTEDGSLFMNEFRDAVAITQNMLIEDVYDEDNVAMTSSPEQLPERTAFDSLGLYAEEIMDNHTKQYETVDELVEDALDV